MPGAIFPEGPALFRGTFHAGGHFPGRSCVFPGDLPCQCPFSRKVLRFSGGPSMPVPVFPEGLAFFRRTFHASARFPGRSCVFPWDLPCQRPFSRKVLRFSGGPSMLEAIFPEGPVLSRGTFHARSHFPGRSLSKCSWSALFRDTWSSDALDSGGGAFLDSTCHHAHPGLARSTHSARVQAKCLTYIHLLKAGS